MNVDPFICPRCGAISYHPDDIRHGYCARCHDYTGDDLADPDDGTTP
jgi:ribosomal protein S27AE